MARSIDQLLLEGMRNDKQSLEEAILSEGIDTFEQYKYLVGRWTELTRGINRIVELRRDVDEQD